MALRSAVGGSNLKVALIRVVNLYSDTNCDLTMLELDSQLREPT
jgi:hypothetical protein